MNKRIKELAEQAQQEIDTKYGYSDAYGNLVKEKFAELIVRECAAVVFKNTGPKSALNVLEHFGVEE